MRLHVLIIEVGFHMDEIHFVGQRILEEVKQVANRLVHFGLLSLVPNELDVLTPLRPRIHANLVGLDSHLLLNLISRPGLVPFYELDLASLSWFYFLDGGYAFGMRVLIEIVHDLKIVFKFKE